LPFDLKIGDWDFLGTWLLGFGISRMRRPASPTFRQNPKFQTPGNLQGSIFKKRCPSFEGWRLGFPWNLVIGIWDFAHARSGLFATGELSR